MARGDVAGLVAQHARQLRLVVGEREQAAGGVDVAARHREGVDVGRVQHREGVFDVLALGGRGDELADRADIGGAAPAFP